MSNGILSHINSPADLRKLEVSELSKVSKELRAFLQEKTQVKEGHINSSLGVLELTVALHYCFDTPNDILIWDVGHQAYAHKILTDRKEVFHTNRKKGGISGFTKRSESPYDPFGTGHSSTSISAAVGFAKAAKLKGLSRKHIAVIGDGALTGGMSFEALNYLSDQELEVVIVHNDNKMSIDPNVGGLAEQDSYKEYIQALGIEYYGSVDGHNEQDLVEAFNKIKDNKGPIFITVRTQRGLGRQKPQVAKAAAAKGFSFQDIFAKTLIALAKENQQIVAITPAMLSGSRLNEFKEVYPERTFDVGIAEQHAVTMAAGMAADGYLPFCHLYSTFAQRAFDQIVHDVALQNLPVVFCLDRGGLVGEDGATHHGAFDPSFLSGIPNLILASPMDGNSLAGLMYSSAKANVPFVIRYAKGGNFDSFSPLSMPTGRGRWIKEGKHKAVISYGYIGQEVVQAIQGTDIAHFDAAYLKPLDEVAISQILSKYDEVLTVEESTFSGGLGQSIITLQNKLGTSATIKCLHIPDSFIEHGTREELLSDCKLDAGAIKKALGL